MLSSVLAKAARQVHQTNHQTTVLSQKLLPIVCLRASTGI